MTEANERAIGDIIRDAKNLSAEQVEAALAYQKQHNVRFGEACIQLGLAQKKDIIWALSQQFQYPYAQEGITAFSSELIVATDPFGVQSEIFRDLRARLIEQLSDPSDLKRALAIVSDSPGDGKSYVAANLAVSFSQLGGRTLLVDADMRSPRQHQIFNVEGASGLSGALSGRHPVNVLKPIESLPNLYLLPVGTTPPNPLELVQRNAFEGLLADLAIKFDYLIVDTPAGSHGADYSVIAAKCGASVVIARKNQTKHSSFAKMIERLSRKPQRFLGVVLNEHR